MNKKITEFNAKLFKTYVKLQDFIRGEYKINISLSLSTMILYDTYII